MGCSPLAPAPPYPAQTIHGLGGGRPRQPSERCAPPGACRIGDVVRFIHRVTTPAPRLCPLERTTTSRRAARPRRRGRRSGHSRLRSRTPRSRAQRGSHQTIASTSAIDSDDRSHPLPHRLLEDRLVRRQGWRQERRRCGRSSSGRHHLYRVGLVTGVSTQLHWSRERRWPTAGRESAHKQHTRRSLERSLGSRHARVGAVDQSSYRGRGERRSNACASCQALGDGSRASDREGLRPAAALRHEPAALAKSRPRSIAKNVRPRARLRPS